MRAEWESWLVGYLRTDNYLFYFNVIDSQSQICNSEMRAEWENCLGHRWFLEVQGLYEAREWWDSQVLFLQ